MSKSPDLLPDLPPVHKLESVPVMPALIAPVFPELAGNFSSMSPRGFEAPPSASLNVLPFVT